MIIARTCTKTTKCVQHFLKTVVIRHMSHQMEAKNKGKVAAATAAVNNHVKVNNFCFCIVQSLLHSMFNF